MSDMDLASDEFFDLMDAYEIDTPLAVLATEKIWADLTDRRGIREPLQTCDQGTQQEIKTTIARIVLSAMQEHLQGHLDAEADMELRRKDMGEPE